MRALRFPDAVLAECAVVRRSLPMLRLSPTLCFLPAIPVAKGHHAEAGTNQDDAGPIRLRPFDRELFTVKKRCRYVDKIAFLYDSASQETTRFIVSRNASRLVGLRCRSKPWSAAIARVCCFIGHRRTSC
jgi:hypothetical protein